MTSTPAGTGAVFTAAVDQATAGYRLPLVELVPAAGRAGFPVLEVPAFAVAAHHARHGHRELARLLACHRVRIGQLSCATGTPADLTIGALRWPEALRSWWHACRLATTLGCPGLSVFVPRTAGDAGLVAARLAELAAVAAGHGLRVNAELHAPALLGQAGRIWERAAAVNAGLLVDVAALAVAGLDPVAHIAALPHGAVGWAHLADLPEAVPGTGRPRRMLPGHGRLPLGEALAALEGGGYRGPVAVEVPRPQPCTRDTAAHLTQAAAALTRGPLARFFVQGGAR